MKAAGWGLLAAGIGAGIWGLTSARELSATKKAQDQATIALIAGVTGIVVGFVMIRS